MGYVFHYNRTTMRKHTLYRVRQKANKIYKHEKPTWYESTQMICRAGRMKHCQTHCYFEAWIKPKVTMKKLRRKVSNYGKKKARIERMNMYDQS